ncbi:DUF3606 domain-containing protein [Bradyrhizobium japonicum]|uniref:DUF3606 domain-containing protein n=1 Tax=Bradyrhizobium japonicum TaxID=375 RepID=UPI002714D888|nr:DUF3606 domain-containing protein [Bradyrhizobium japonicum]WLB24412.1 DUF3606 domain-containing protein [Bradyrhizobium japonicum]
MHEDFEVKYWTKQLGVSKDELQKAVDKVGNWPSIQMPVLGVARASRPVRAAIQRRAAPIRFCFRVAN